MSIFIFIFILFLGADVAYISFNSGDKDGWVRLTKENSAKECFEKMTDGKVQINGVDVKFQVLEGDDEKAYLEKTIDEMSKRRKGNNKKKGTWNQKGYKGRKRKQDGHEDAPSEKIKAE